MSDTIQILIAPPKPARRARSYAQGRSARREIVVEVDGVKLKYNFALTPTGDLIVRRYRHKRTVTLQAHELIKLSQNLQEGTLGL